jgi:acyl-CoA reductase-like NAD-dependent aldehyde dehydrogenase
LSAEHVSATQATLRTDNKTTRAISAMRWFAPEVESGNLRINWSTAWRPDLTPYGGLKDSGMGKEEPKYAIREMTEEKMVVLHLKSRAEFIPFLGLSVRTEFIPFEN